MRNEIILKHSLFVPFKYTSFTNNCPNVTHKFQESIGIYLSNKSPFEIFGMGTTSLTTPDFGLIDPTWEPFEVTIAKHRIAVDLDGVKLRQMRKCILLQGRDDVLGQVDLLQRGQSNQGLIADRLDLVPTKSEDLKVG